MFNQDEIFRYTRHFSVKAIGINGQEKIKQSSVLLVGVGGIGSPAGLYLTAMGIGKLGLIDFDQVELSNLQRQVLFSEQDEHLLKAQAAKKKLSALNKHVDIEVFSKKLDQKNAASIISQYDYVLDGSDNYQTRYLVADTCRKLNKPLISASIFQFSGQLIVLTHQKDSPCYRCLYPHAPREGLIPNCAEAGVLGSVPGVLGTMAATEVVKQIIGLSESMENTLLNIDLFTMSMKRFPIKRRQHCWCQTGEEINQTINEVSVEDEVMVEEVTAKTLQSLLKKNSVHLLDVRQGWEREVCFIPGSEHKPLAELDSFSLSKDKPIVCYCKLGGRSAQAAKYLMAKGHQVFSLKGGILAWAEEVSPDMTRY